MRKKDNIALIGFMGTGKSTVGKELSKRMNMRFVEIDKMIEEREGMSIAEIFAAKGEGYFRKCETEMLKECMEKKNTVISCGGGLVLRNTNTEILKEISDVVLLTAQPITILKRISKSTERPVLNGNMNEEYIRCMLDRRNSAYMDAADIIVSTDDIGIIEICKKIQSGF